MATELAGDIGAAATALGGLLLVFIGAVTAGFDSYPKEDQASVLGKYRRRGWLALGGFLLALASAVLAFAGKWTTSACFVIAAVVCLGLSLLLVSIAAVMSVLDIK